MKKKSKVDKALDQIVKIITDHIVSQPPKEQKRILKRIDARHERERRKVN